LNSFWETCFLGDNGNDDKDDGRGDNNDDGSNDDDNGGGDNDDVGSNNNNNGGGDNNDDGGGGWDTLTAAGIDTDNNQLKAEMDNGCGRPRGGGKVHDQRRPWFPCNFLEIFFCFCILPTMWLGNNAVCSFFF